MKRFNQLILILTGVLLSLNVFSYDLIKDYNGGDNCSEIRFQNGGQVKVVLHRPYLFSTFGFTSNTFDQFVTAMEDVHASFNRLGGTSVKIIDFNIVYGFVDPSMTDPDTFDFDDDVPTLHVGFSNDPDGNFTQAAAWAPTDPDKDNNCEYKFAKLVFKSSAVTVNPWIYKEPTESGENYWDAGSFRERIDAHNPNSRYMRLIYVHEMLHAFGLKHAKESFSMMNGNDRPWLNRSAGMQATPLPDDVRALRYLYPENTDHFEVGLVNTWFAEYTVADGNKAQQYKLCAPSLGDSFGDKFDTYCGSGGSVTTSICPGDQLKARVSVANFSTSSVNGHLRIFFSEDEAFDSSDFASNTVHSISVNSSASSHQGRNFEVPRGQTMSLGKEYTVFAYFIAYNSSGTKRTTEYVPLNGKVKKSYGACMSMISSEEESDDAKVIFSNKTKLNEKGCAH